MFIAVSQIPQPHWNQWRFMPGMMGQYFYDDAFTDTLFA